MVVQKRHLHFGANENSEAVSPLVFSLAVLPAALELQVSKKFCVMQTVTECVTCDLGHEEYTLCVI